MIAIGHDEEVGGDEGAGEIARLLTERGIKFHVVLDEGGFIMSDAVPFVEGSVAFVGIAEKGMANFHVSVPNGGGHSALPIYPTPIGRLSAALTRLEANQPPATLDYLNYLTDFLLSEMNFAYRLVFANTPYLAPLLTRVLSTKPKLNAMLRTTTAPTMLWGSPKKNVIPSSPTCNVNFRVLQSEKIADVERHIINTVNDPAVKVQLAGEANEPSKVSPVHGKQWDTLQQTISETFPDVSVAPYLVVGGTDSRWYQNITDHVYRFLPVRLDEKDIGRIHGIDERVHVDALVGFVQFYYQFFRNSNH
mmetsp:Transcript_42987/g.101178  ORF Transcript_42987/g.101178 Transcript_42987/m.101178 type:complete len:306 (+) Transcript_42987:183-1100(+)